MSNLHLVGLHDLQEPTAFQYDKTMPSSNSTKEASPAVKFDREKEKRLEQTFSFK